MIEAGCKTVIGSRLEHSGMFWTAEAPLHNWPLRRRPMSATCAMAGVTSRGDHISERDLERFHLGMMKDEAELARLEEHLLTCSRSIDIAEASAQYVDAMRAAIGPRCAIWYIKIRQEMITAVPPVQHCS